MLIGVLPAIRKAKRRRTPEARCARCGTSRLEHVLPSLGRIRLRLALATAFVVLVLPAPAKGQSVDALSLQSGARARILGPTTHAKYELITVASVSPDSLRYSLDPSVARGSVSIYQDCTAGGYCTDIQVRSDTATKALAWQQISKMDASMGRQNHTWRGAGIGFLVGLIGGAALGGATIPGCCDRDARELRVLGIIANGLLGGAIGGLVGGVIGSTQRTEDWMPVTLPRTPVASNRVNVLGRPAVPVAQSGSCVSDTTEDAKQYHYGYGAEICPGQRSERPQLQQSIRQ